MHQMPASFPITRNAKERATGEGRCAAEINMQVIPHVTPQGDPSKKQQLKQ
jgi:hypothetical protein